MKKVIQWLKTNKKQIFRSLIVFALIGVFAFCVYLGLEALNLTSAEQIQAFVNKAGIWGVFAFLLLSWAFMLGQALLPTFAVYIAGVYIFGLWQGIVIGIVGVVLGAFGLFFIGRKFGTRAVKWVAGKENVDKWREVLTNGKYTLALLLLFPVAPDELLFILAGVTRMSFKSYAIIILITKPIGVVLMLLLGGGAIIPLTWAYAWLWAIIGLIIAAAIWYSLKNQHKIDNFIKMLTNR